MLKKIWIKLLAALSPKSNKETLSDILSDPYQREGFLGVRRESPPSFERIIQDNERVIIYAKSYEYSIWAQEIWAQTINCIDKLTNPQTDPNEVDFYRGALAQNLDSLRISYKAMFNKQDAKEKVKRN